MFKKIAVSVAVLVVSSLTLYGVVEAKYSSSKLISNAVFTNTKTMNASQIQSFLSSKGGGIAKKTWNGKRASQIIYEASQTWGINPQVILATLQKEQSLITDPSPSTIQYRSAMGYGCPDAEDCNSEYGAFTSQIVNGTWQLRFNYERAKGNNSWYNPNISYACKAGDTGNNPPFYNNGLFPGNKVTFDSAGSLANKTITIANAATASLYCYTPHVGPYSETGYSGSYNFVTSFESWFGSTQTSAGVNFVRYDTNTDKTGERAKIGVRLTQKPTKDVKLSFVVSSPSNAKIVSGAELRFTPSNWSDASQHIITVEGLNNSALTDGSFQYNLQLSRNPVSADPSYDNLTANDVDKIPLVQINTSVSPVVYRLYNSNLQQHTFTSSRNIRDQLIAGGWKNESSTMRYCTAGEQTISRLKLGNETRLVIEGSDQEYQALAGGFKRDRVDFSASRYGDTPVYWLYNQSTQRSLYTSSQTEINQIAVSGGFENKGIAFRGCSNGSKPVFRMYRPSNTSHFYTKSPAERNSILRNGTYRYENIAFYTSENEKTIPVYRLYRKSNNAHFYTTSKSERDLIVKSAYRYEGVAFYLKPGATRDIHRLYRKSNNTHFFTASSAERDGLQRSGFRYEGVTFKAN